MSENVNDLTVDYEENGQLLLKEIDKAILSKGAWATVLFRYRQYQPETDDYSSDKFMIQRYQKLGGEFKPRSKFKISSTEQARKIVEALSGWLAEAEKDEC